MNVLFCAYRDWALNCAFEIIKHTKTQSIQYQIATTQPEMELISRKKPWDIIVLIGWSWKIPSDIVNSMLVVGMHPSDLPEYSGGSPIQNQILDGVENSIATLFRLNEKFDEGQIIDKHPINLSGHLNDVFRSISEATTKMVLKMIQNHPNHVFSPQPSGGSKKKRLKPEDSKLLQAQFSELTTKQIYDLIRCREDPYPNAYIEDNVGKLYFKLVEFIKK